MVKADGLLFNEENRSLGKAIYQKISSMNYGVLSRTWLRNPISGYCQDL